MQINADKPTWKNHTIRKTTEASAKKMYFKSGFRRKKSTPKRTGEGCESGGAWKWRLSESGEGAWEWRLSESGEGA